jgi:hypothetical protein
MCKNCLKKDIQNHSFRIVDLSNQISELVLIIKSKMQTDIINEELNIIERISKEIKDEIQIIESKVENTKLK